MTKHIMGFERAGWADMGSKVEWEISLCASESAVGWILWMNWCDA